MTDTPILRQLKEILSTREEDIVKTVQRFSHELKESKADVERLSRAIKALN